MTIDHLLDPEHKPTAEPFLSEWREQLFAVYGGSRYAGAPYAGLVAEDTTPPTPGPGLFLAPEFEGVILD